MSPLEQHGFLGEEIKVSIAKIRSDHSDLFDLAVDTNKLCHKTMFDLTVHNRHAQEVIIASLYLRCLNTFQSVVLLSERGLIPQAQILARALLETVFTLCALCKKSELVNVYINEDKHRKLRSLYKLKKFHIGKFPDYVKPDEIETLEKELQAEVKRDNVQSKTTEAWAADAELTGWYLTAYTVLSHSVHTKVSDLDRHLAINDKGEIAEFIWGPDDSELDDVMQLGIEAMIIALQSTIDFFRLQRDEAESDLRARLESIILKKTS